MSHQLPFSPPDHRELLVVGDVQGCRAELDALLASARFDTARHRLALVGDLINRGPESRGVLARARELDALVVVGNHEDGLLRGKTGESLERTRAQLGDELSWWLEWMAALPTFLRVDPGGACAILVHAGIPPGKRPESSTRA